MSPLPASYLGEGVAWPQSVVNVPKATDPGATPKPQLSMIYKQVITTPAVGATTAFISTPVAGPNTTTVTYARGSAQWNGTLGATGVIPNARNVVVTVTHGSSVVATSGTITGVDIYGKTITEAWSVTAGGTTKTYTGVVAFKRVDSISITAAADSSANSVTFGTGNVFGLEMPTTIAGAGALVKELEAATLRTTGTVVARNTAANTDRRGTFAPAATPNGTLTWTIWYIVDDPTLATT